MVATLDVRKFFPSTNSTHLRPVVAALGFVDQAATDLLALVTLDNELPQGAPSSSILSNLAFDRGDAEFIKICCRPRLRRSNLRYSRYADDIAVSGDRDLRQLQDDFVHAIELAGYDVAPGKIRFMPSHERQIVTGLVVNERLRPTREYTRSLKCEIRNCLENGAKRIADGEGLSVMQLKSRLNGQVAHIMSVDQPLGRRLRGMMCAVDWTSRRTLHPHIAT